MKLMTTCMICFEENGVPSPLEIEVEYTNEGQLIGVCPSGHKNVVAIQNFDCEILFDMGGMALLDGFTREAVTAFAAALERAYELYVRVIFAFEAAPWKARESERESLSKQATLEFESVWKELRRHSERQLGAFVMLFAIHERAALPLLNSDWVKFRNECTHKGVIPSRDKALRYGNLVLEIIEKIRATTKSKKYEDSLRFVTVKHLIQQGAIGSTMGIPTMASWMVAEHNRKTLEERLPDLERWRKRQWKA
jgi:hypothetical protein